MPAVAVWRAQLQATVVIGGIITNTVLTLVVLPVLYELLGRMKARSRDRDGARIELEKFREENTA